MMIKNSVRLFSLFVLLTALFGAGTAMAGLVGEPAPALNVREWIKGGPVEVKPGTNIYLLVILETKLPASRACVTNLNSYQSRFKNNGLEVVAVSDESPEVLKAFMATSGSNVNFALAADSRRHTALAYMKPVLRQIVPYSFIIGTNGHVLWHGQPQHTVDEILERIISGNYNEDAAVKLDITQRQMEQYLDLARQGSDRAKLAGRNLLASRTNDVALLCEMAYVISTFPRLPSRDFALADEALTQAEKLAPDTSSVRVGRAIWTFESGKRSEGLALATKALAEAQTPMEKTNVLLIVNLMEGRMKPRQAGTNQADGLKPEASGGNP